jgi:hypothetical protein
MKRISGLIELRGADVLKIEPLYNKVFIPAFIKFDISHGKVKEASDTSNISELYERSIKIFSSMKTYARAALNDIDDDVVASAEFAEKLFDRFRNANRKGIKEHVSDIESFMQLCEGQYKPYIEKLNIWKLAVELKAINEETNGLLVKRVKEQAAFTKTNATKEKKDLIDAYNAICSQVELNVLAYGKSAFEDFIREINVAITECVGKMKDGKEISDNKNDNSENTEDNSDDIDDGTDIPEEIPEEEDDMYPNAKEYNDEVSVSNSLVGDIFYIFVNGEKVYYKLLDRYQVTFFAPGSEGSEAVWEKL